MTGSPTRTGRRSATSFVRWSSASRSLLIGFGSSSGLTRARQRHPNRAEICHIVQHVENRDQGPSAFGGAVYGAELIEQGNEVGGALGGTGVHEQAAA